MKSLVRAAPGWLVFLATSSVHGGAAILPARPPSRGVGRLGGARVRGMQQGRVTGTCKGRRSTGAVALLASQRGFCQHRSAALQRALLL